jgi:AraC-like DNA-binding protein
MIPAKPSAKRSAPPPIVTDDLVVDDGVSLDVVAVLEGAAAAFGGASPTLLMPIEAAVARITIDGDEHTIDRSQFVIVPPGGRAQVTPSAAVVSLAVLGVGASVVARMAATHAKLGVSAEKLAQWWATSAVLPRTVWVHEIVHRYVFERHALEEHDSDAARFLEVEIVKEVYFLFRDRDEGPDRATIQQHKHSRAVERAVAFIDAHLFEPARVSELVDVAGVSESALLRAFRREVGVTPAAYWRSRKLDGALDLVRGGRHTMAEIAELVGYENATAFGDAFRRRFGRPPSSFKPAARVKPAP